MLLIKLKLKIFFTGPENSLNSNKEVLLYRLSGSKGKL
jgi:hypothetical protein